jgi:hypothetical protein
MATLNPLSQAYSTRRNIPYTDTSTTTALHKQLLWFFKAALLNQITTGTLSGTRVANSIWAVVNSSDGVTSAASDLWGATYDASKIVLAASGTDHSWIVMQNTTLGYQCLVDSNNVTAGNARIAFTDIAHPFAGGTVSASPTIAGYEFNMRSNHASGVAANWANFTGDVTTGGTNWFHATFGADGTFFLNVSRGGQGMLYFSATLQKTIENQAGDTNNVFCVGDAMTGGGRGAMAVGTVSGNGNAVDGRLPVAAGGALLSTGGLGPATSYGGTVYAGSFGTDALDSNFNAYQIELQHFAPSVVRRGKFPDFYLIGTATVGAGIPAAGATQERIILGDTVQPFIGGSPNI